MTARKICTLSELTAKKMRPVARSRSPTSECRSARTALLWRFAYVIIDVGEMQILAVCTGLN